MGVTRNTLGTIKISQVSRSGNTATLITTVAHNLSTGAQVRIVCSNSQFTTIGVVTITQVNATTFTYTTTGSGTIALQSATGTVILPNIGKAHSQGSLSGIAGATTTNLNVDYYEYIENIAFAQSITGLVSITSPVSATKLLITNNTLVSGNAIVFTSVGNLSGVNTTTTYFVVNADSNGITIATTSGGTPITITYVGGTSSPGLAAVRLQNTLVDPFGSSEVSSTSTSIPINNPDGLDQIGIYLLINTEIVRTVNLPSSVIPYTVQVERGVDGTSAVAHQPGDRIVRLIKTDNATYIFPSSVTSNQTNVNLAEFSGAFKPNDILRIDKNTSSEEFVTITTVNTSDAQTFSINNGGSGSSKLTTFNVVTTTGDTDILGDVTIGFDNGTTSSTSSLSGPNIVSGGGNLKVHNSIELSGNTSTSVPSKQYFVVTNGSSPRLYVESATGNTRLYNGANFQVFKDSFFTAGTFDKNKVDGASDVAFEVLGSSGNTRLSGTLTIGDDFTIRNGLSGTNTITMDAQLGTTVIGLPLTSAATGATLTLNATYSSTAPAATSVFSINNLGTNNDKPFRVRLDGSVQAFGIDNYFTKNGGRRTNLIDTGSGDLKPSSQRLKPNIQYLVKPTGNLTLYLPLASECVTGDIVRFIDIQGNLNYNVALKIRSEVGTNIQKSQGGSGGYGGGELIVNTPNAGFGLMFVGETDSSGTTTISSDNRGWWLVEV